MDAIVLAAGEGRRLRPVTERWPKAVLPIDGRPVAASLLRELAAAGCVRVWLVVGHLADQVETLVGDGSAFGVDVRYARQPEPLGSADATARALQAGAELPALVAAADTLFRRGDIGRFGARFRELKADGAIAARRAPPPGPGRAAVRIRGGFVERAAVGARDLGRTPALLRPRAVRAGERFPGRRGRRGEDCRDRDREDPGFDGSA